MTAFIPIHSFRRGTGKSSIIANFSVLLATENRRVGVIDTDILSPSLHVPFGLSENEIGVALNDYLRGRCDITQAVYDVTSRLAAHLAGRIMLIPASPKISQITRALRQDYDLGRLGPGLAILADELALDALLIDTHSGLSQETLIAVAMADTLIILLRPDRQDYHGTGLTVELARHLGVRRILLIVNEVPASYDFAAVKAEVEQAYQCEVVAVLPHREELTALASADIFSLRYPDHPLTAMLRPVAIRLMAEA